MPEPAPLYDVSFLPDHLADLTVARAITDADDSRRTLVDSFTIPIRSGLAWRVKAGQVCRILTPEGPQVGDLNVWNADNPRERLWASRTRQIHSAHVTVHDRLWSCLPYLRPLVTFTRDTLGYGTDSAGGRCHDLLGSRCDPYFKHILTGENFDHHCHSNLVRAIRPFGLEESDVHDVLNVFQVTGLVDDRYFIEPCPAAAGDYLEFLAEIDLLCALSTCPGGDLKVSRWGPGAKDNIDGCRPLGVEVYDLDTELLEQWASPGISGYTGGHGLTDRPTPW